MTRTALMAALMTLSTAAMAMHPYNTTTFDNTGFPGARDAQYVLLYATELTFLDAQDACAAEGATLAEAQNQAEVDLFATMLGEMGGFNGWVDGVKGVPTGSTTGFQIDGWTGGNPVVTRDLYEPAGAVCIK